MGGYNDLVANFESLRGNVAIFRRVVLHCHSPSSYDYKESPPIDESQFHQLLGKVNLDMVAITDHMKCNFACQLSSSVLPNGPCVLPGMEVRLEPSPPWNMFKIHLIVIFPEGYTLEQVCKFIPSYIPEENKRNGSETISKISLEELTKKVKECGGIVIAAHVDSNRGVRRAFKQLGRDGIVFYDPNGQLTNEEEQLISEGFKDWILSAGFDAIEVTNPADKMHYRWVSQLPNKIVSIPVLLSNDAHSVQDIDLSNRVTNIKMTSVGFAGLKQALEFADTRIRFPDEVPTIPSPRILGIQIIAGGEKGFFNDLQVAFSDNLTCLIGPRGSGKSTIIEALRYVFGYNRTLEGIESNTGELATKVRNLQEATLSNCVIRVAYCHDHDSLDILEAAYDSKQDYTTRVYTKDGDDKEITDVEATGTYPLRLFGWGELETLGREANRQRDMLDRLIQGLNEKLELRKSIRSDLAGVRRDIESTISRLSNIMLRNKGEIKRYREYKRDFDNINTTEVKNLFSEIDVARAKLNLLNKVENNAQNWLNVLEKANSLDIFQDIEQLIGDDPEVSTWWEQTKAEIKLVSRQSDIRNEIEKGIAILKNIIRDVKDRSDELGRQIQQKEKAIREKVSLEAAKQVAVELRRTARERLERVANMRHDYETEWNNLQTLLQQWKQIAYKLTSLHDEISGKRAKRKEEIEASLNRFGTQEISISIKFVADDDRSKFKEHLSDSGFLNRDLHGNFRASRWPEKIAASCTPIELAEAILEKKTERLVKSAEIEGKKEIKLVDESMAQILVTTLNPFGIDEDADVLTIDEKKLKIVLTMAEVEWDDYESILLNGRLVENLSPGQRSSAMLPLIALVENAPLVIDQPEDNLDNRLIGKMLVDILADLKEKRQIIVATHNPNIVVSGDAEQVIVLDAESASKGRCIQSGSIDVPDIVDSVIDIMEGGQEAFRVRQKRYAMQ